jgi:hypothetical protein
MRYLPAQTILSPSRKLLLNREHRVDAAARAASLPVSCSGVPGVRTRRADARPPAVRWYRARETDVNTEPSEISKASLWPNSIHASSIESTWNLSNAKTLVLPASSQTSGRRSRSHAPAGQVAWSTQPHPS